MKKLILLTAALVTIAFQAEASDYRCVPTKSVESARSDYDYSIQLLDENLAAEYEAASVQLQQDYDMNLAHYEHHVKMLRHDFKHEVNTIKRDLNPGWREAIDAATDRHNNDLLLARDEYHAKNEVAKHHYNQTTEESRLNYNYEASLIADEYNRAVCAGA